MPNRPPAHRPSGVQTSAERKAAYVAERVSPSRTYDRTWQRLRGAYLLQSPLCECGCLRPAEVVHHKQPHLGDRGLLLDWDNLEALAKPCHDRITAKRDGGFGNPVRR